MSASFRLTPSCRIGLNHPTSTRMIFVRERGRGDRLSVGVDFDGSQTRLVAMRGEGGTLRIEHIAEVDTDPSRALNPRSRSSIRGLAKEVNRAGLRGTPSATCLSPMNAHVRLEEVGRMDGSAILRAVTAVSPLRRSEGGTDALVADYHEIRGKLTVSHNVIPVISAVSRRDAVRSAERLLRQAGLRAQRISVTAAAVVNGWIFSGSPHIDRPVLLLHGSTRGVVFVLIDGGQPIAVHAATLRTDPTTSSEPASDESLNRIIQEARRTIGSASSRWAVPDTTFDVQNVLVSGELALFPSLLESIAIRSGKTVEILDPLSGTEVDVGLDSEIAGPLLVPAVGLAAELHALEESDDPH